MRARAQKKRTPARRTGIATIAGSVAAAVLFTPVASLPAMAQETAELEVVLVTARKREERAQDVPDQMRVFTEAAITDAAIQSTVDLAQNTPGLFFSGDQFPGLSVLTLRGVSQAINQDAPVSYVIDGVPLSNSLLFAQPLFDIEQVEVLRGPQGSLYGRNAVGGAINIRTKDPGNELERTIYVEGGRGDNYIGRVNLSGPIIEDKLLFRVTAAYETRDGLFNSDLPGHFALDDREAAFGRAKLLWTPNDAIRINWQISGLDEERHSTRYMATNVPSQINDPIDFLYTGLCNFPWDGGLSAPIGSEPGGAPCPAADGLPADGIYQEPETPNVNNRWWDTSLSMSFDLGPATLISTTGYTDIDLQGFTWLNYIRLRSFAGDIHPESARTTTQELRLVSNGAGPFTWLGGVFFQNETRDRSIQIFAGDCCTVGSPSQIGRFPERKTSDAWGVFGHVNIALNDRTNLTLGARYDEDKRELEGRDIGDTYSAFQPKATLQFKPTAQSQVYATYSRGFRPGGVNGSDFANPGKFTYDQEDLTNYEIGFKSSFADGRVDVNGAVYREEFTNWQYYTFQPGAQALVNADGAEASGWELEILAEPLPNLDLRLAYSDTDTEVTDYGDIQVADINGVVGPASRFNGAHFMFTPRNDLSFSAQYRFAVGPSSWEIIPRAEFIRRGKMFLGIDNIDRFGESQAAYDLANFRLSLERPGLRISAFVENAFDEFYIVHGWIGRFVGEVNGIGGVTPGLPRYVGLSAEVTF